MGGLRTPRHQRDAGLLPDGNVDVALGYGTWYGGGLSLARWDEYRLDGTLRLTFTIGPGIPTDRHEMLTLPNGGVHPPRPPSPIWRPSESLRRSGSRHRA